MPVISDLLALLRRPITAAVEPAPGKARGRVPAPDAAPLTEAELVAAIGSMAAERQSAYETITAAGGRREALLMRADSDAEILELGRQVDAANLLLERLDRIEPDLLARLKALRDDVRRMRWVELRDLYITAGRRHVERMRANDTGRPEAALRLGDVLAEFPNAAGVLPRFPCLPSDAADAFAIALDRLAVTQFDPNPPPPPAVFTSAAEMMAAGDLQLATFGGLTSLEARPEIRIAPFKDGQVDHAAASIVPGWQGVEEIRAGRAALVEE